MWYSSGQISLLLLFCNRLIISVDFSALEYILPSSKCHNIKSCCRDQQKQTHMTNNNKNTTPAKKKTTVSIQFGCIKIVCFLLLCAQIRNPWNDILKVQYQANNKKRKKTKKNMAVNALVATIHHHIRIHWTETWSRFILSLKKKKKKKPKNLFLVPSKSIKLAYVNKKKYSINSSVNVKRNRSFFFSKSI